MLFRIIGAIAMAAGAAWAAYESDRVPEYQMVHRFSSEHPQDFVTEADSFGDGFVRCRFIKLGSLAAKMAGPAMCFSGGGIMFAFARSKFPLDKWLLSDIIPT